MQDTTPYRTEVEAFRNRINGLTATRWVMGRIKVDRISSQTLPR